MKILWRRAIASLLICPLVGMNDRDRAERSNCQWRDEGEGANPRYVLTILGALNGLVGPAGRVLTFEPNTWKLRLEMKWW
jgi:hypothetical protein